MSERSRWKETITIWTTVHSAHAGQAAILKGTTAARNPSHTVQHLSRHKYCQTQYSDFIKARITFI